MIGKIIRWSLNNRLLVTALGIILFVCGTYSAINTPVDVLPEFAPPQVVIQTNAPGLAAEEVESIVTIPLESTLNGLPNIQAVRSSSIEGLSFVTVVFKWDTDIFRARQLVAEKVQLAAQIFPKNINAPILSPITSPIGSIYFFALTSKITPLIDLRTYADWEIRNKLLSVPGVARVLVYGGDLKQYQVLVNPNKLRQYNIGLNQVVEAANKANVIVGGGYLVEDDREYLIRGIGKINSIEELGNSVIAQKENIPIYLKDIANVKIEAAFKRSYGSIDGKEAVIIAISRQPGVNTLEVNKGIQEALDKIKKSLPRDIKITQTYSQSDFINVSIKNILWAIFEGSILVIIVLLLFLGSFRTSFISLTAIPLSLIVAILILKAFGQTINSMTLGGLAVAVGEIVDDAIIGVENVYKRLRQNKISQNPRPAFEVIFNGSCEVRNSVVYGTYIITVVFLPVLFLTGLAGQIFKPLAWAYIISLLASLGVALTLTPAMCFYLLSKNESLKEHEPQIITILKEKYLKLLDQVLNKPRQIFISTVILSLIAIIIFFTMGRSFLPELGEENLVVMAIAPPGTSLKATQRIALRMEKKLHRYLEIVTIGNRAGRSELDDEPISANTSHFDITLKSGLSQERKEDLIKNIREDFEHIPGVITLIRSFITETIEQVITGQRAPIILKLYGNNLETLQGYASKIAYVLSDIKTLQEVQVEPVTNIPQIHIKVKKKVAARYGLRTGDLLEVVQIGFNGISTHQRVIEGQKSFDLFVWFDKSYRRNIAIIKNTLIDTPMMVKVPLGQLADVMESTGPNIINREKVSRRIVIQANAKKTDISKSVEKAEKLIKEKIKLPEGYTLEFEGDYKQQQEANKKLFFLSILVLVGIYLLLSLAFKSFKIATIIMINLPLALIGGVLAIAMFDGVLSIASIVGFITLFGLSTRNSILLVNRFFDIQRENPKLPIDEVIKRGALDRLPPILMTALTASFAMLPLALFPGAGREIEHPLAIVILGGMFSATALTLLIIPVIYKEYASKV
ncbi:MAG: efflux RND transporter permease subunit [Candidatus Melainabacteria bacterium]|nr:efflux RND transporter permease subunit [Candidatus Melainabacteria bacterium]